MLTSRRQPFETEILAEEDNFDSLGLRPGTDRAQGLCWGFVSGLIAAGYALPLASERKTSRSRRAARISSPSFMLRVWSTPLCSSPYSG